MTGMNNDSSKKAEEAPIPSNEEKETTNFMNGVTFRVFFHLLNKSY
jgi:hypothetical protein